MAKTLKFKANIQLAAQLAGRPDMQSGGIHCAPQHRDYSVDFLLQGINNFKVDCLRTASRGRFTVLILHGLKAGAIARPGRVIAIDILHECEAGCPAGGALTRHQGKRAMKRNISKPYFLAASSMLAISSAMSSAALAQSGNSDIEQVVVSASRISIAGYQQPTPVSVVGAAALAEAA